MRTLTERVVPLALAVTWALLSATGCDGGADRESTGGAGEAHAAVAAEMESLNALARVPVETLTLTSRPFTVRADYTGTLQPQERIVLKAEIEGSVERVRFEEGALVERDAELVRIDTRQLSVRRDQAESDLALAESEFLRAQTLSDRGLIARAQLDQARNARDAALNALRTAEIDLEKSVLRAPAAGLIKTRAVAEGEYLSKGQLIAEVLVVRKLRARVAVPETELRYFGTGKSVEVELDALPERRFAGTVVTVGAEADAESRTFPLDIEIDNASGELRAGMLARVTAALATYDDGLLVPRHAILEREQGRVAFVAVDGHAELREVRLGASVDAEVQVLKGLTAGEQLIVAGQQRLGAGELIRIVPTR